VRTLSVSLRQIADIRRELGRAGCIPAYEEALALAERIGDHASAAVYTFNLGHAYKDLPALRDLDQAERWYRRSLELRAEGDRLGRGGCAAQLGAVALERFKGTQAAGRPESELLAHLNEAAQRYHVALDLTPPDALGELGVYHNQLGSIYLRAGDLDRAVRHFRQAIHLAEAQGDLYWASRRRFNVSVTLLSAGRRADALEYANAALRGFETFGERAADWIENTRGGDRADPGVTRRSGGGGVETARRRW
jgi:tetratricopeptide (TPR) repeat protein